MPPERDGCARTLCPVLGSPPNEPAYTTKATRQCPWWHRRRARTSTATQDTENIGEKALESKRKLGLRQALEWQAIPRLNPSTSRANRWTTRRLTRFPESDFSAVPDSGKGAPTPSLLDEGPRWAALEVGNRDRRGRHRLPAVTRNPTLRGAGNGWPTTWSWVARPVVHVPRPMICRSEFGQCGSLGLVDRAGLEALQDSADDDEAPRSVVAVLGEVQPVDSGREAPARVQTHVVKAGAG